MFAALAATLAVRPAVTAPRASRRRRMSKREGRCRLPRAVFSAVVERRHEGVLSRDVQHPRRHQGDEMPRRRRSGEEDRHHQRQGVRRGDVRRRRGVQVGDRGRASRYWMASSTRRCSACSSCETWTASTFWNALDEALSGRIREIATNMATAEDADGNFAGVGGGGGEKAEEAAMATSGLRRLKDLFGGSPEEGLAGAH